MSFWFLFFGYFSTVCQGSPWKNKDMYTSCLFEIVCAPNLLIKFVIFCTWYCKYYRLSLIIECICDDTTFTSVWPFFIIFGLGCAPRYSSLPSFCPSKNIACLGENRQNIIIWTCTSLIWCLTLTLCMINKLRCESAKCEASWVHIVTDIWSISEILTWWHMLHI